MGVGTGCVWVWVWVCLSGLLWVGVCMCRVVESVKGVVLLMPAIGRRPSVRCVHDILAIRVLIKGGPAHGHLLSTLALCIACRAAQPGGLHGMPLCYGKWVQCCWTLAAGGQPSCAGGWWGGTLLPWQHRPPRSPSMMRYRPGELLQRG